MNDDWVLIVGINRYPRAGVEPHKGAVYAAKEFYK